MSDQQGDLVEELRLLMETVLERVEPALRQTASAEDKHEWDSCTWCPLCATVALIRGEHHELISVLADRGTAVVTVLREAIAGMPVEPVWPQARAAADVAAQRRSASGEPDQAPVAPEQQRERAADHPKQYVAIPVTIRT